MLAGVPHAVEVREHLDGEHTCLPVCWGGVLQGFAHRVVLVGVAHPAEVREHFGVWNQDGENVCFCVLGRCVAGVCTQSCAGWSSTPC